MNPFLQVALVFSPILLFFAAGLVYGAVQAFRADPADWEEYEI